MKQISLFIPLLGTLLLSGCAGTSTEFECNEPPRVSWRVFYL